MTFDPQARLGFGFRNQAQKSFIALQRLAGPVFTDFAEETVLNGIPFGGAAGVVAHGHPQTKPVHQLLLQDILPGAHPGAVAAAAVG
jgi:hypothetical protein